MCKNKVRHTRQLIVRRTTIFHFITSASRSALHDTFLFPQTPFDLTEVTPACAAEKRGMLFMPPFFSQHHAVLKKIAHNYHDFILEFQYSFNFSPNLLFALSCFVFFQKFSSLPSCLYYPLHVLCSFMVFKMGVNVRPTAMFRAASTYFYSPSFYRRLYIRWPYSELLFLTHTSFVELL